MKVKTIVTSYMGGVKQVIAQGDTENITHAEYEENLDALKSYISSASYFEIGGVIIPGDFIRNNCTISIVIEN